MDEKGKLGHSGADGQLNNGGPAFVLHSIIIRGLRFCPPRRRIGLLETRKKKKTRHLTRHVPQPVCASLPPPPKIGGKQHHFDIYSEYGLLVQGIVDMVAHLLCYVNDQI